MKVCIFSKTPLAAAPWEIFKALRRYTDVEVSLVNLTSRYRDGRVFPNHLLWVSNNGAARDALRQADVWHVHNYWWPDLRPLHKNQKVIAQFHSLPRLGNWRHLMDFADVSYTIQQPLHEQEYKLPGLPNIINPDEYYPTKRTEPIKIAFAPTNRAPIGNPASKGYNEVKRILQQVKSKRDIEIVWIEGKSYEENLQLKRESHILIDDVVTGNWHRTSLEGACFGCVVINRINKVPFLFANLNNLLEKLLWLIDDKAIRKVYQQQARLWVLQEWHAIDRIQDYIKAYKEICRAR